MQFSETATKTGILQHIEQQLFGDNGYGQITGNTNRLYDFTNRVNRAYDDIVNQIFTADGTWQFDDNNKTDLTIATSTLAAVQDISLSTDHIIITRVRVKDASGNYYDLKPAEGLSITTTTGQPQFYDKRGSSLILDVVVDLTTVTASDGIEITFQRPPSYFVYTDTTKVPGFSQTFHPLLATKASLSYAFDRDLNKVQALQVQVADGEAKLQEFYARRLKDEVPIIRKVYRTYN